MTNSLPRIFYLCQKNDTMENKEQETEQQINVELPEDLAEGVYSNLAMIAHSNSEFILDFIR